MTAILVPASIVTSSSGMAVERLMAREAVVKWVAMVSPITLARCIVKSSLTKS